MEGFTALRSDRTTLKKVTDLDYLGLTATIQLAKECNERNSAASCARAGLMKLRTARVKIYLEAIALRP